MGFVNVFVLVSFETGTLESFKIKFGPCFVVTAVVARLTRNCNGMTETIVATGAESR